MAGANDFLNGIDGTTNSSPLDDYLAARRNQVLGGRPELVPPAAYQPAPPPAPSTGPVYVGMDTQPAAPAVAPPAPPPQQPQQGPVYVGYDPQSAAQAAPVPPPVIAAPVAPVQPLSEPPAPSTTDYLRRRQGEDIDTYANRLQAHGMGDLEAGWETGKRSLQDLAVLGVAAVGQATGMEGVKDWGMQQHGRLEKEMQPFQEDRPTRLEDIKDFGSFVDFAQYQVGNIAPSIIESVGAAVVGGIAGSTIPGAGTAAGAVTGAVASKWTKNFLATQIAKSMAPKVVGGQVVAGLSKEAATVAANRALAGTVGAGATMFASSYLQGVGDIYGETLDEKQQGDLIASFFGGIPYAALDTVTDLSVLNQIIKGSPGAGALARYAKNMLWAGAKEGAAESGQEALLMLAGAQNGKEYTSKEVLSRLGNSFAAAAIGGAILGAPAGRKGPSQQQIDAQNLSNLAGVGVAGREDLGGIAAADIAAVLGNADADPVLRSDAVARVTQALNENTPELADLWSEKAAAAVTGKQSIAVPPTFKVAPQTQTGDTGAEPGTGTGTAQADTGTGTGQPDTGTADQNTGAPTGGPAAPVAEPTAEQPGGAPGAGTAGTDVVGGAVAGEPTPTPVFPVDAAGAPSVTPEPVAEPGISVGTPTAEDGKGGKRAPQAGTDVVVPEPAGVSPVSGSPVDRLGTDTAVATQPEPATPEVTNAEPVVTPAAEPVVTPAATPDAAAGVRPADNTPPTTTETGAADTGVRPVDGAPDEVTQGYEKRWADRAKRVAAAKNEEEITAVLQEEYADGERHTHGTTQVEKAQRLARERWAQDEYVAKEQASFDAGNWVDADSFGADGKTDAEKRAAELEAQDPTIETWVSKAGGDVTQFLVKKRKRQTPAGAAPTAGAETPAGAAPSTSEWLSPIPDGVQGGNEALRRYFEPDSRARYTNANGDTIEGTIDRPQPGDVGKIRIVTDGGAAYLANPRDVQIMRQATVAATAPATKKPRRTRNRKPATPAPTWWSEPDEQTRRGRIMWATGQKGRTIKTTQWDKLAPETQAALTEEFSGPRKSIEEIADLANGDQREFEHRSQRYSPNELDAFAKEQGSNSISEWFNARGAAATETAPAETAPTKFKTNDQVEATPDGGWSGSGQVYATEDRSDGQYIKVEAPSLRGRWMKASDFKLVEPAESQTAPAETAPAAPEPMPAPEPPATAEPQEAAPTARPVKVSANTVFTEDDAEKARALLRKKLGQLSSGIDPEVLQAGIVLAGYHVEKGARTFAAYAKAMMDDMGEMVRPHLKQWYMAVKMDPRATADMKQGMDSMGSVEDADLDVVLSTTVTTAATTTTPRDALVQDLVAGKNFKSIVDARKRISEITGTAIEPGTAEAKRADEMMEQAAVLAARNIVNMGLDETATFDLLANMSDQMPSLNVRTSTSIAQQAYSTPIPLAYVASRRVGGAAGKVLEPTAGNGALVIEADPKNVEVNELNPDRAAFLREQGFKTDEKDATDADFGKKSKDVVSMNPPFGAVKDDDGTSMVFDLNRFQKKYKTHEIDHAIALNALEAMKDDGRAVLIVGGPSKTLSDAGRSDAYHGKAKREFYVTLYRNYNVVDHFTVSGDLYSKQGAAWPVDVIVIEGRGKSALTLPAASLPRLVNTVEELRNELPTIAVKRAPQGQAVTGQPDSVAPETGARPEGSNATPSEPTSGVGAGTGPENRPGGVVRGGPGGRAGATGTGSNALPGGATENISERGGTGTENTAKRPRPLSTTEPVRNTYQAAYTPASSAKSVGTLVPTNMQTVVQEALDRVSKAHGSVDAYVAKTLDYKQKDLPGYFSAEQIDALALALDNIERGKGFIIGDQTGVGKGRVVAAIIRYAKLSGRTPIFVTEKPNLYGDMLRDLSDIGMPDMRPLATNSGFSIPLDADAQQWYADAEEAKENGDLPPKKYGEFLNTSGGKKHAGVLSEIAAKGGLGEDYDVVFTTYSQMQTVAGKRTNRQDFLEAVADGGVVIFDESHNAGGTTAAPGRGKKKEDANADESGKTGRAGFARTIARKAHGVFYSSATYAKRPDVMDLYFKTDMGLAADSAQRLAAAMEHGGVPLQQVVAAMLASAGQYIRREKSFDGIEYATNVVDVDRQFAENASSIMRAIMRFDELKQNAVNNIDKDVKAEGSTMTQDGSTGGAGASSTNFTSLMHNVIAQMLLTLKVQPAIADALDALKKGRKPIITLSNTMGSMIDEYVSEMGLNPGDAIGLTFGDLLKRYLQRSRRVTVGAAFGPKETRELSDEELGPVATRFYRDTMKLVDQSGFGSVPISPIDAIHDALRKEGYKTGEITGRQSVIDYSGEIPIFRRRPGAERTAAGKIKTISDYNSGALDALVLNQSGATGLSAHASEKFADQRRRYMIVAQAEANIDTHMQMLGRTNRTGQITTSTGKSPEGVPAEFGLPAYSQLVADIPAEKRPAAVLSRKMAMLNASTTAAKDSALKAKDTPDFMNEYGDQVAAQVMTDNEEWHKALGTPLAQATGGEGLEPIGAMRKVTGRIPILRLAEQERVYKAIEDGYAELIDTLDRMGENKLEAKTIDLDAKQVDSVEVSPRRGNSDSPFADGTRAETMDVKRIGKPIPFDDMKDLVVKNIGGTSVSAWRDNITKEFEDDFEAYRKDLSDDIDPDDPKEVKKLQAELMRIEGAKSRVNALLRQWSPNTAVTLVTPNGTSYQGFVGNIERKPGSKTNPAAAGGWKVTVYVADAAKQIKISLSRVALGDEKKDGVYRLHASDVARVKKAFDEGESESRQERVIITGNLLSGYSAFGKGQIINFTTSDGDIRQGILMPAGFDLDKAMNSQPVTFADPYMAVKFLGFAEPSATFKTEDGNLTITGRGGLQLLTPKSKAKGAKYFNNKLLKNAIGGEFVSVGNQMRATFTVDRLPGIMQAIYDAGFGPVEAITHRSEARDFVKKNPAVGSPVAGGVRFQLKSATNRPSAAMSAAALQTKISDITSRWAGLGGLNVRVVQRERDLPAVALAELERTRKANPGVFPKAVFVSGENGAPGEIVLVANNIGSVLDAVVSLAHEGIGHYGVRSVFGENLTQFLDELVKDRAADVAKYAKKYGLDMAKAEDSRVAAEELLAHMAENGAAADLPFLRRVYQAMRAAIRAMGFHLRLTDGDLREILVASRRFVEGGAGGMAGAAGAAQRFMFAGQKAATADTMALSTAQSRLDAGEDADIVRQETGWFKGDDGKWRFEIDDSQAALDTEIDAALSDKPLTGVLHSERPGFGFINHPALFAAYPELAGVPVRVGVAPAAKTHASITNTGVTGAPFSINVTAKTNEEALSALLHEIQHGIQHVEGFASGGSQKSVRSLPEFAAAQARALQGEKETGAYNAPEFDLYKRLSGEVEARNTQARQGLSRRQRRAQAPDQTQDVPASDVIVMFNGKEALSAPMPANAGPTEDPVRMFYERAEAAGVDTTEFSLGSMSSSEFAEWKKDPEDTEVEQIVPVENRAVFVRVAVDAGNKTAEISFADADDVLTDMMNGADNAYTNMVRWQNPRAALKKILSEGIALAEPFVASGYKRVVDGSTEKRAVVYRHGLRKMGFDVTESGDGAVRFSLATTDAEYLAEVGPDDQADTRLVPARQAKQFDASEKVTLYRAMSMIDGKLYPPMSARMNDETGKLALRKPEPVGKWMRSEERPDLVPTDGPNKGKFPLKKPDGGTTWALYAPYFHASPVPLNDQFTAAWQNDGVNRAQLVTVEVEVPASEMTSGYKAQGSIKKVGTNKWKAGVVASKIPGGREVVLSRYARIKRVVPDSEVAQKIAAIVTKNRLRIPENTVTPQLRAELENNGVQIAPRGTRGSDIRFSLATPQEYAEDMRGQTAYLNERATKAGYKDGDEFSSKAPDAFIRAASAWRADNPANTPQDVRFSLAEQKHLDNASQDLRDAYRKLGMTKAGKTLRETAAELTDNWQMRAVQGIFDRFAPLKELGDDLYSYMLARMASSSDQALEMMMKHGTVYLDGGLLNVHREAQGGALQMFQNLAGEHNQFLVWEAANRADQIVKNSERAKADVARIKRTIVGLKERRADEIQYAASGADALKRVKEIDGEIRDAVALLKEAQGRAAVTERNLSPEQIAAGMEENQGTMPDGRDRATVYAETHKRFKEFHKAVLDVSEQAGDIDPASRAKWEQEFYVNFARDMGEGNFQPNIGSGLIHGKPIHRMKGGVDATKNLLDNTLSNWAALLSSAARTNAAASALLQAETDGKAQRIPRRTATHMGLKERQELVSVRIGGKETSFEVPDKNMLVALRAIEPVGLDGPVMRALQKFKRALTIGVTAAPAFKFFRNPVRDMVTAIATSELGKNPYTNMKAGFAAQANKDLNPQFTAGGGAFLMGTSWEGQRGDHVRRLLDQLNKDPNTLNTGTRVLDWAKSMWEKYEELGDRMENVQRAALYTKLISEGKSHLVASYKARDLMDFSLTGAAPAVRMIISMVPFMNARLQGLYKLGRAGYADPVRMGSVLMTTTLAGLALALLYRDDDDWKKREDWDKENYYWFKVGDTAFRIPRPFEIGALGSVAEATMELFIDDEMTARRFRSRLLSVISNQLNLDPTPQLVRPLLDVAANRNAFTGAPIESMGMERLLPQDRFNERTTEAARMVSTGVNAVTQAVGVAGPSPLQIDSLVAGYLGWLGTTVLGVTDLMARPALDRPERPSWTLKKMTQGIAEDLANDPARSRYVTQFYEQSMRLQEAYASWKQAKSIGDEGRAESILGTFGTSLPADARRAARLRRQFLELSKQRREIERGPMSGAEKSRALFDINQRMDEAAKRVGPLI